MVTRVRLRRRTEHRLVSGVAGGIADRLNAPVGFVRGFIVLASFPAPWMLWAYAGATLVIPPSGRDRPDWDNAVGLARFGLLVGAPAVAFFGGLAINEPLGGPAGWWVASLGLSAAGALALLGADYWRGHSRTRAEARSAVMGGLPVVACGAVLAAAMLLAPNVRWERWLPIAAVVGATALLLGARRRVHGLMTPAMVALALTGLVIAGDARLQGGLGDTRVTPQPGERIVARRAIGDLALDLRRAANAGRPVTVEASVGIGTLRIGVPEGARVEVEARVGKGSLEPLLDSDFETLQGFEQRISRTYLPERRPRATGAPWIRVRADVGLGTITIGRDPSVLEDPS
jgi:phage shock protein PspC (stress-responsive transcriptional regulator)